MILQQARERLRSSDDEAVTELLNLGVERLRSATQELRNLSRGIYPASLSTEGLVPAVENLVLRSTLNVDLRARGVPRLPETIETTAYFVVAEALTNILKHAHADNVVMTIAYDEDKGLLLTVADDGTGLLDETKGTGVRGLHERVRLAGGRLSVTAAPGAGTNVMAEFPTARAVDAAQDGTESAVS